MRKCKPLLLVQLLWKPQMERKMLIERTKAGLDAAKKKGRQSGRKRKMTNSKLESAKKLLTGGSSHKEIAKDLGLSIATLYRWLQHLKLSQLLNVLTFPFHEATP